MKAEKIEEYFAAQGIHARLTDRGTIAAAAQNGDLNAVQIAFLRENKREITVFLQQQVANDSENDDAKSGRFFPRHAKRQDVVESIKRFVFEGVRFYKDHRGYQFDIPRGWLISEDDVACLDDICIYWGELATRARLMQTKQNGIIFESVQFDGKR